MRRLTKKAGYTATPVACGWAGAMLEKAARAIGQDPWSSKLKKLKNSKKVIVAKALDGQR